MRAGTSDRAPRTLASRRKRSLWWVTCFLILVVATAAGAVLIGPALRSPAQVAAEAAPPSPSVLTATVESRRLTEPITLRGRVEAGRSVKLTVPAAAVGATSVVTAVRVRKGARVAEGSLLMERSGLPMFALTLAFPLYRDLGAGSRGPDVSEVQRALRRLGYRCQVTGVFDTVTRSALVRFYDHLGYPAAKFPADSGTTDPVTAGDAAETPAKQPQPAKPNEILRQADVFVINGDEQRISKVLIKTGQVLDEPKQVVLELDGQAPTITTAVAQDQKGLLKVGQTAKVTDEVAGSTGSARITSIGSAAVTGADGDTGFEVRFAFQGKKAATATDRSVRLDVAVAEGETKVLAAPVAAVNSRPDGSLFVSVVTPGKKEPTDVTVATGQVAGGWVEVIPGSAAELRAGSQVVVGSEGTDG